MKKFLTSVFMLSMVLFSMNVFNSCKDYDEDEYNDLIVEFNKNDATLRGWITTNYATIQQLKDSIAAVQARLDACCANCSIKLAGKADTADVRKLADSIADLRATDKGLQAQIDSLNALLKDSTGNVTNIINVLGKVADINTKVTGLGATLEALENNVYTKPEIDSLLNFYTKQTDFLTLESKVNDVVKEAAYALALAKNDSVRVNELQTLLNGRIDSLATVTDALDAALKTAEENSKKADELLQNQIDAIVVGMDDILNKKIPALEEAYQEADQLLQDSIDALALQVKQNTEDIEALNDSIDKIMGRLDDVDEALKSLITGIVIQGTANPVFGSFSLPIGINSNVLMAFYGKNDNPVVFPTKDPANYVKASQTFTDADWNMISSVSQFKKAGNSVLFNEASGNAGTIYVTVNPGSVDFAGQTLELVNSKDEASKIVLEPLVKENDVELTFGYTRSAETNGFYSAQATLSEEDINAVKIKTNDFMDNMKTAFKNILTQRSVYSVGSLASELYKQFNGALPAQGVKASWTDYNGDHSIYSQYGIAATAVKPLSFAFLEDLNVQTIPGYERAISLVDRVADKIKSKIPSEIMGTIHADLDGLNIKTIELKELTAEQLAVFKVEIDKSITIDDQTFTLGDIPVVGGTTNVPTYTYKVYQSGLERGTVTIPGIVYDLDPNSAYVHVDDITVQGGTYTITYVKDMSATFNEIWGETQGQIDDVNKMIVQLQDLVNDAQDVLDKANNKLADANEFVGDMASRVKSYIDRLNNKAASILNNANARIQPILLVGNRATGIYAASRSKGVATKLAAPTVEFILTSYTAEIVTPAFKKHIAVTNVFKDGKSAQDGDAACKAALTAVNAGDKMNTVIDGNKCSVVATFQKGYIYEVAYSALDYSGKISMNKYYVQY